MKKLLQTLLLSLLVSTLAHSQTPKEGAIPIEGGFVVYVGGDDHMSYTLTLRGDVGIENYPILRKDDRYYIIETAPARVFGSDDKTRLSRFMGTELRKLESSFEIAEPPVPLVKLIDSTLFSLWSVDKPVTDTTEVAVSKYYYLDFIKRGTLFRIQHPSTEVDDKAARVALYQIYRNMHFYQELDVPKLQDFIAQGQYYY